MRLLTDDEDEDQEGEDYDSCPYCKAWIGDLVDDVDFDNVDLVGKVFKSTVEKKCPSCHMRIALVVECTFHLRKFKGNDHAST